MPNVNKPAAIIQKTTGVPTTPTTPTTPPIVVTPVVLTKFQFRKLFTTAERVLIDNIEYNPAYSGTVKAVIATFMEDLRVSGEVVLNSADVIAGVSYLESVGLIAAGRKERILANLQPL